MGSGPMTSVAGGIACVLVIALIIWVAAAYHRLVRLQNQADASWAQIDVLLKRRYDLSAGLVQCVRGYSAVHEHGVLDAVVAARGTALDAARRGGPSERSRAESELTRALGRLSAVAEAYPEMKAGPNFRALQIELANTDDRIAYARQSFTGAVRSYNEAVRTVPTNLLAGVGGFRARQFFQAGAGDEHGPVEVRF